MSGPNNMSKAVPMAIGSLLLRGMSMGPERKMSNARKLAYLEHNDTTGDDVPLLVCARDAGGRGRQGQAGGLARGCPGGPRRSFGHIHWQMASISPDWQRKKKGTTGLGKARRETEAWCNLLWSIQRKIKNCLNCHSLKKCVVNPRVSHANHKQNKSRH